MDNVKHKYLGKVLDVDIVFCRFIYKIKQHWPNAVLVNPIIPGKSSTLLLES